MCPSPAQCQSKPCAPQAAWSMFILGDLTDMGNVKGLASKSVVLIWPNTYTRTGINF
jgi:hypothetical protein